MNQPRILLVEDEPAIADTLVYALRTEGFLHLWVQTGADALKSFDADPFDLVVLDVGLPDTSGFEVCRELRRRGRVPVLFLTARHSEIDRIVGLEIGGDDYVVKPFSPREVTARVRAILRRVREEPVPGAAIVNGRETTWLHDEERCQIRFKGRLLPLTRNEYRLLAVLLRRPGRVFSREDLLRAAWDEPEASMDRTVDAHVKSLRAKLRTSVPGAEPIETHRGLGYSLKEDSGCA